jgi:nitroreductase/NAD-dependent dihydropyrimidine dehydrogenase PreA subunit
MLNFTVNRHTCTSCGECAADCPARIITFAEDGFPQILPEQEAGCYKCQHCLAICPTGAVSILGRKPEESITLAGNYPRPEQLETLMKGRRSVRRYRDQNVEPALLQRLLEMAWHAPTGVNSRQVRLTVVDDKGKMTKLRKEVLAGVGRLVRENALPERFAFYADFVRVWEEEARDVVFRGAPHLLVASAPQDVPCPLPDCLIALSYFELFAQANGVGTVWCGLAKYAIDDLLPETRTSLGIPEDHLIGYVMLFGMPAVSFSRTVQHRPTLIHRVE